jgi:hypothetical protein
LVKAAKGAKGANKRDLEANAVTELLLNGWFKWQQVT